MDVNFYPLLKWILLPPLAGFLVNGLAGKKFLGEKAGGLLGSAAILVSFVFAALSFSDLLSLPVDHRLLRDTLYTWISAGSFAADAAFRFDPLSAVMALIVTGVSLLIHIYSTGYMKGDAGYNRYFAYLNLFVFFMLVLVLADNPLVMFVGWEGVGLCSYLLIGFWYEDPEKASAGKKAFITNRVGDAGFLVGLMLLFSLLAAAGAPALDFAALEQNAPLLAHTAVLGMAAPTLIALLLFFGATGKSAQFPLYVWLPDAMAGPTPVSALIHAATMVTAGVYMLARLHFLYELAPRALEVVMLTGCFTAFFAAVIGLLQKDIKKVLAYSTISQLGYMFIGLSVGAFTGAMFHLTTHAFF
ncbi:MAG: NADH-quinone oxidoreductase subunit L, partial [Elusimicrobiota bacterium]